MVGPLGCKEDRTRASSHLQARTARREPVPSRSIAGLKLPFAAAY